MRVLWFAGNPALYSSKSSYNGGGWIASLQREISHYKANEVELGVAFPWSEDFKEEQSGYTYYGVKNFRHAYWNPNQKEKAYLKRMKSIIDDFRPDIIHVFGTEERFGIVGQITDVPVVIHIQGLLSACYESYMPQNLSWIQFCLWHINQFVFRFNMKLFIQREKRALSICKYVIGRTRWDSGVTSILAPNARYYYNSEMLRPQIYNSNQIWHYQERVSKKIVSVISNSIFKGGDIILRTARILKEICGLQFEWEVYGIADMRDWSRLTGIDPSAVSVTACGIISAQELVSAMNDADLFVHPSYIENSSNTVCEAQVLGVPVIANNVGGLSSLIEDGSTGSLVPANDVYFLSHKIVELLSNRQICLQYSENERSVALSRHDPKTIVNDLFFIYTSIISEHVK